MDLLHASRECVPAPRRRVVPDAGRSSLSSQPCQGREVFIERGSSHAYRVRQSLHLSENTLAVGLLESQRLPRRIAATVQGPAQSRPVVGDARLLGYRERGGHQGPPRPLE
jgi:hypothetical protein